mmetsp:Transcript_13797/g.29364  ORF Transcript_13797/g.29364 Transcript_13797/m.29364 type:complete len:399 (-) Transcript_13797:249-1445(-)
MLDLSTVVGMHLQHTSDTLVLALYRVVHRSTCLHDTRVNTGEGKGSNERIVRDLESQGRERLSITGITDDLGILIVLLNTFNGLNLNGTGEVVDNSIQKRLDTLVLKGGSSEHWNETEVEGSLPQQLLEGVHIRLISLQVFHKSILVLLNSQLHQLLPPLRSLRLEFIVHQRLVIALIKRNLFKTSTQILSLPDNGLHGHKINDSQEITLRSNRQLEHGRGSAQHLHNSINAEVEVGSSPVHLIQETHAGDLVLISLTPDSLRLRLHSSNTIENSDSSIKNTKGTLNLQGEINVTGGVNDVDAVIIPCAGGGGGGNGNSALLLLLHPVHGGTSLVDLSNLVGFSGVVEDTFGGGGLSSIDVGHDTDVAVHGNVNFTVGGGRGGGEVDVLGLGCGGKDE